MPVRNPHRQQSRKRNKSPAVAYRNCRALRMNRRCTRHNCNIVAFGLRVSGYFHGKQQEMAIELHTWGTPNGRKISVALEEMGLPYTVHPINISKGEQFTPDFLKITPKNRSPAIVAPDGPGGQTISIFESGAILIYLGEKTGKFWPKGDLR